VSNLKEKLLSDRLPRDVVPIDGVGDVTVRGLSRQEVLDSGRAEWDSDEREVQTVALCMVEPRMTPNEVREWRTVSDQDEIWNVYTKIMVLSKLAKESAKAVYQEFEASPDLEFRALPGAEAGDDGGSAEGRAVV